MSANYFIVDHVSDENKKEGVLESYQMIPVQYTDENGNVVNTLRRLNFVYWPDVPSPLFHEEWTEDLIFNDIYSPSMDYGQDDDDDDELEFNENELNAISEESEDDELIASGANAQVINSATSEASTTATEV